jgi:protoheme IX farnesyltransferase
VITTAQQSQPSRLQDYLAIAKPRIAVMVLFTVAIGFVLGSQGTPDWLVLLHTCLGVGLAATASNALNQVIEQHSDGQMARTRLRPLPAGRLSRAEVTAFGVVLALASATYLALTVNWLTAGLTFLTILLYAGVYTPLKRYSEFCTAAGAVPGALPPVLGWVASGAPLNLQAGLLFSILLFWQFPHFLAIAWIYRRDYSAAGLKMLPSMGGSQAPGMWALGHAILLLPFSIGPWWTGLGGVPYLLTAALLGLLYCWASWCFLLDQNDATARRLLKTSFAYLPGVFLALLFDFVRLSSTP